MKKSSSKNGDSLSREKDGDLTKWVWISRVVKIPASFAKYNACDIGSLGTPSTCGSRRTGAAVNNEDFLAIGSGGGFDGVESEISTSSNTEPVLGFDPHQSSFPSPVPVVKLRLNTRMERRC